MCGAVISSPISIMLTAFGNIAWRLGREIRNLEHLSPCIAYAQNRCSLFGVMCGSIFILTEKTSTFPNSDFCCCFFSLEAVAMFINSTPPHPIAQCEFLWIATVSEKAKGNIHSRGSFVSSGMHDLPKECYFRDCRSKPVFSQPPSHMQVSLQPHVNFMSELQIWRKRRKGFHNRKAEWPALWKSWEKIL